MAGLEDKFKYSRIITQDCKKLNLSVREKAFADLIALGWKDTDAFILTNLYNPVYSAEVNLKELNRYVLEDVSFKEYLASQMKKTGRLEKSAKKKAKAVTSPCLWPAVLSAWISLLCCISCWERLKAKGEGGGRG